MRCHVCEADDPTLIGGFSALGRVASDCRPWSAGGELGFCRRCGAVQKILSESWRHEVRDIYDSYEIYHQSPDGAEQPVFDRRTGQATPRSQKVLQAALASRPLARSGRMIDVGCGNGAMLRAFAALHADWALHGFEPNVRDEAVLRRIPGMQALYTGRIADVPGRYDVVTIAHALEHIENPLETLRTMRALVSEAGCLLIQVPYYRDNPFDLVIADHCTHYTKSLMRRLLHAAGFQPLLLSSSIVEKELTVLAVPGALSSGLEEQSQGEAQRLERELAASVAWLAALRADAEEQAAAGHFGIFGTAIAGNWLFGQLPDKIAFFVDEDASRVGQNYRGRPVRPPAALDREDAVYMTLPRPLAASIADRLTAAGALAQFRLPPPMPEILGQIEHLPD